MLTFCSTCGRENKNTSKFCSGCGAGLQQTPSPSGPLTSGTMLKNRYKIIELIKAGGMGAVYKATDDKLDRICAVKELLPPYGTPQQQAQAAEWFNREAKLLAKLSHANLPGVIDYFTFNGRYYLVMKFIEGLDLETILQRDGKPGLTEDKVVDWSKQILTVLEYLHNQKPPIVYRDIKPGNIMLHKDGRAMLIDFGIARSVQEASQTKKTAIGTEGYAPPEQCRGQVEPRSDIYALGATMHHLLTGVQPIPFMFEPVSKTVKVSPEVEAIVMKALSLKVEDRFKSAGEMGKSFSEKQRVSVASQKQPVMAITSVVSPTALTKVPPTAPVISSMETYVKSELILIPDGTFQREYIKRETVEKQKSGFFDIFMGIGKSEVENLATIYVNSFYIGKYPVTNKEYKIFKPQHKGEWSEPDYPVETVNWYDAVDYCNWLSEKDGFKKCYSGSRPDIVCDFSKNGYRLPTDAEWEYACRAGSTTDYYWNENVNKKSFTCLSIDDYCWYNKNSNGTVHPVGQKTPNTWGLYDMIGNVDEWCWDWRGTDYYTNSPSSNPIGPDADSHDVIRGHSRRVIHGGAFYTSAYNCQSSHRISGYIPNDASNSLGFRIVRPMINDQQSISTKKTCVPYINVPPTAPIFKAIETYLKPEMVLIPDGTFQRKYIESKTVDKKNPGFFDILLGNATEVIEVEKSATVHLNSFYIGKYPVINKEYKLFKSDHKGRWSEPDYPVETVSWYDAVRYCNWLSGKEGLEKCYSGSGDDTVCDFSKNGYRLPTEIEWEYACRAGTTTKYYWGNKMDGDYCWYGDNSGNQLHPVGQKKSNQFGLYDMSGNVWEWCWDWYDESYYSKNSSNNSTGPSSDSARVNRGGGWYGSANYCWSACRSSDRPSFVRNVLGFRLARSAPSSSLVPSKTQPAIPSSGSPSSGLPSGVQSAGDKKGSKLPFIIAILLLCIIGILYIREKIKPDNSVNTPVLEMVLIEGGVFEMGGDMIDSEKPVHTVEVSNFYMGKYEVMNKEYRQFAPGHSGKWSNDNYAVENVSWYDAVNYCNWLSDKEGFERCYSGSGDDIVCNFSKNGYRLPTEAEWEYACRAGTITEYYWGDEMNGNYCWYGDNSGNQLHPVGQKKSNQFGLYDMSGNVWEWCWDWYDESYYSKNSSNNPTGPSSGSKRVIRGGCWSYREYVCRSAYRYNPPRPDYANYFLGFRLVRSAPSPVPLINTSTSESELVKDIIREKVQGLVESWEGIDIDRFKSFYSDSFANSVTDKVDLWIENRIAAGIFEGDPKVIIEGNNIEVKFVEPDKAEAKFILNFKGIFNIRGTKILVFTREDGDWLITGEDFEEL